MAREYQNAEILAYTLEITLKCMQVEYDQLHVSFLGWQHNIFAHKQGIECLRLVVTRCSDNQLPPVHKTESKLSPFKLLVLIDVTVEQGYPTLDFYWFLTVISKEIFLYHEYLTFPAYSRSFIIYYSTRLKGAAHHLGTYYRTMILKFQARPGYACLFEL